MLNTSPSGLPGDTDQPILVSRSSATVSRAAAPLPADEPCLEVADLAVIALRVAHDCGVPVADLRWALAGNERARKARRIFFLAGRELTGALTRRLAWYVSRDEAEVEAELAWATDEERTQARAVVDALVRERRKIDQDRLADFARPAKKQSRPADRTSNRPGACPKHDGEQS